MMATDTSESQARAQLESVVEMVKRLEHAQECDGDPDDCQLNNEDMGEAATESRGDVLTDYHDADSARQAIFEDPLAVEYRSGWYSPGSEPEAEEFRILLCTGGPAVQIVGELGQFNAPAYVRLEHQDWFTPWTELVDITDAEREALQSYCEQFIGI